ncbi:MAG: 2-C-methyl-D-erythritol 4-phosphate cytidylyltransferase [Rikenellaceae bacterium]
MKIATIIVAGGSGVRMGADIPKQFLPLCSKPILMHTIQAFYDALGSDASITVALPSSHITLWNTLVEKHNFTVPHTLVCGGETRFHSVKAALDVIHGDVDVVLVHDGVRPLIKKSVIDRVINGVKQFGAVIPVIPISESIRIKDGNSTKAQDRELFVAVQTPQAFDYNLIRRAYDQKWQSCFTDDASLIEALGEEIYTVKGDVDNIKITTSIDLFAATKWLEESCEKQRNKNN